MKCRNFLLNPNNGVKVLKISIPFENFKRRSTSPDKKLKRIKCFES